MAQASLAPAEAEHETASKRRWLPPLGVGVGVAAATTALWLRDPHQSGSWGLCPLRALTGLNCPLCGGLRAVNDLTNGDLSAAWHSNALFVGSIPILVALWVWWLVAALVGKSMPTSHRLAKMALYAFAAIAVAFWVFRNTPWGQSYWA